MSRHPMLTAFGQTPSTKNSLTRHHMLATAWASISFWKSYHQTANTDDNMKRHLILTTKWTKTPYWWQHKMTLNADNAENSLQPNTTVQKKYDTHGHRKIETKNTYSLIPSRFIYTLKTLKGHWTKKKVSTAWSPKLLFMKSQCGCLHCTWYRCVWR